MPIKKQNYIQVIKSNQIYVLSDKKWDKLLAIILGHKKNIIIQQYVRICIVILTGQIFNNLAFRFYTPLYHLNY
jgi:hypothetical protein